MQNPTIFMLSFVSRISKNSLPAFAKRRGYATFCEKIVASSRPKKTTSEHFHLPSFFDFFWLLSVLCLRQSLNHAIFNIQPFGLWTLRQTGHTHDAASDGHNHFGTGIDYKVANGNFEMGGYTVCLGIFGE